MGQPGPGRAGLSPPPTSLPARWSALHHGLDPHDFPLLRGWLSLMWRVARPLAVLRVPPTVLTVVGVLIALDAVLLAGRAPWAAALAVLLAALCDGLDGAVAVVAARWTRTGAIADAVADRIADAAFAAVLWRCGTPWPLAVLAGALALGVDAVRRVRRQPAVVTVAERPAWTICALLACASAAVTTAAWPVLVCAGVWIGLGAVGLAQLIGRPFHRSRPPARSRSERNVR